MELVADADQDLLTFGWQNDLCDCETEGLLSRSGSPLFGREAREVRVALRSPVPTNRFELASSHGHVLPPCTQRGVLRCVGSQRVVDVRVERRGPHVAFEVAETLVPGQFYVFEWTTRARRRPTVEALQVVLAAVQAGDLDEVLPGSADRPVTLAGVSQSGRAIRTWLRDGFTHPQLDQGFAIGAGAGGMDEDSGSLSEGEDIPCFSTLRTDIRFVDLFTSGDVWVTGAPDGPERAMVLDASHGVARALLVPSPAHPRLRLGPVAPIDPLPSFRALFAGALSGRRVAYFDDTEGRTAREAVQEALARSVLTVTAGERHVGSNWVPASGPSSRVHVEPLELRAPIARYHPWAGVLDDASRTRLLPGFNFVQPLEPGYLRDSPDAAERAADDLEEEGLLLSSDRNRVLHRYLAQRANLT